MKNEKIKTIGGGTRISLYFGKLRDVQEKQRAATSTENNICPTDPRQQQSDGHHDDGRVSDGSVKHIIGTKHDH